MLGEVAARPMPLSRICSKSDTGYMLSPILGSCSYLSIYPEFGKGSEKITIPSRTSKFHRRGISLALNGSRKPGYREEGHSFGIGPGLNFGYELGHGTTTLGSASSSEIYHRSGLLVVKESSFD